MQNCERKTVLPQSFWPDRKDGLAQFCCRFGRADDHHHVFASRFKRVCCVTAGSEIVR